MQVAKGPCIGRRSEKVKLFCWLEREKPSPLQGLQRIYKLVKIIITNVCECVSVCVWGGGGGGGASHVHVCCKFVGA